MKISKESEYGLRAMACLAKSKKVLSIREISNIQKMPYNFLAKIFMKLEKAKLVKAKRGGKGGYFLAKPASKITTADVVAVLEEDLAVVHCQGCPMAGGCSSRDVWDEVKESISKTMGKKTLADLIR
jgi:Rrf2 family protein